MKENPQEIIGLRQAAKRVKEFFVKKPLKLQCAGHQYSQKYLRELVASHHYLLIKSITTLKWMPSFSFVRNAKLKSSIPQKKLEPSSDPRPISNDQHLLERINDTPTGEGGLSLGRVHGWRLKEFFLVKKQLESLQVARANTRSHDIAPFFDGDPDQEAFEQTQEWQNQLGAKEERQFRITRITNILSS